MHMVRGLQDRATGTTKEHTKYMYLLLSRVSRINRVRESLKSGSLPLTGRPSKWFQISSFSTNSTAIYYSYIEPLCCINKSHTQTNHKKTLLGPASLGWMLGMSKLPRYMHAPFSYCLRKSPAELSA